MTLDELTAKFWTAAKHTRCHPDYPQEPAQRLLIAVAEYATGTLQKRAKELIKDAENVSGTRYPG